MDEFESRAFSLSEEGMTRSIKRNSIGRVGEKEEGIVFKECLSGGGGELKHENSWK